MTRRTLTVSECHCLHCGKRWFPRSERRPTVCPRCKSANYDRAPLYRHKKKG
mgnify:CR=1 FL=1